MSIINSFHGDNFKVIFSNIPQLSSETKRINIQRFNNFVHSVTIPDFNMEIIPTEFKGFTKLHPIPKRNNELTQLLIEMTLDEDMINYTTFYNWMQSIRQGNHVKSETSLYQSTIKAIRFQLLDNELRVRKLVKFSECMLINLSALNLVLGSSEEVKFSLTFSYEDMTFTSDSSTANN